MQFLPRRRVTRSQLIWPVTRPHFMLKETISHARHTGITVASSDLSRSSQDARGPSLRADDSRVAEKARSDTYLMGRKRVQFIDLSVLCRFAIPDGRGERWRVVSPPSNVRADPAVDPPYLL